MISHHHRWYHGHIGNLRNLGLLLGLVFWGSFPIACEKAPDSTQSEKAGFLRGAFQAPVSVVAFVVAGRDVPLVIESEGKTEVSDRFQAKASSPVKVQKVFVEAGDRVQPGDPLIQFDDATVQRRLNLARAEIREAEAGLAYVNSLERGRDQLVEEGKLSETELESLDEKLNLYQATLDRARAQVELYESMGGLEQINSPLAGIVSKREVSDGVDVTPDQVLMEVVRLDPLYFSFLAPSEVTALLDKEVEIVVRFPFLQNQEFSGELAVVGAEAEPQSRNLPVKVRLLNPDLTLKAEMSGTILIRTQERKKVFNIPETALVRSERSTYVYKIEGQKVKRIPVTLEASANGQIVVEKGLVDGDTIVVSADGDIRDGSSVEIQSTRSEKP